MGRDSKTNVPIAHRRTEVARQYLTGARQHEIAERLGVNQATISRDLTALQASWREDAADTLARRKAEELAKLDNLEREHWEGYRRKGDPRFLSGVLKCVAQRCRILGLDAPARVTTEAPLAQISYRMVGVNFLPENGNGETGA